MLIVLLCDDQVGEKDEVVDTDFLCGVGEGVGHYHFVDDVILHGIHLHKKSHRVGQHETQEANRHDTSEVRP